MRRAGILLLMGAALLGGCNQPFEPVGPTDRKLVLYGILNALSDTQYVRVAATFGVSTGPAVTDAVVTLAGGPGVFTFRDTIVQWRDTLGNPVPTHVYIAYHAPIVAGTQYTIRASTPEGLTASCAFTAMKAPSFSLQTVATRGYFVLSSRYGTQSGAAAIHFYLDYYALVGDAW
ncbi:MAG TPA: DUF4249 family protein, partial [Bacteroidota bacterium]|nr:DUF4249 family protein [Bacteroidota bacterium]